MNAAMRTAAAADADAPVLPVLHASDGCFAVEKAGHKIELTLEETRAMVRYLDLVGEQLIDAAAHAAATNSHPGGPSEQRH